jgi:hypothetical protein
MDRVLPPPDPDDIEKMVAKDLQEAANGNDGGDLLME